VNQYERQKCQCRYASHADAQETCIRAARDTGEAVSLCCAACHLCCAVRQIAEQRHYITVLKLPEILSSSPPPRCCDAQEYVVKPPKGVVQKRSPKGEATGRRGWEGGSLARRAGMMMAERKSHLQRKDVAGVAAAKPGRTKQELGVVLFVGRNLVRRGGG
jgi:hypothetical protein